MSSASASGSRARRAAAVLLVALAFVAAAGTGLWIGWGGLGGKPTPQTIIFVLPRAEDPSATPTLAPSATQLESPSASITASPRPTRAPTPTPLGPVQWFPDGPNLVVASIHLDPADPECDDIFKIILAVSNIGDAPAGEFSARVSTLRAGHPEMQADYTIPGLEAGRSWGKVVDWTTSHSHCGEAYQVLVEVDFLRDIVESDEGDNIGHLGFVP